MRYVLAPLFGFLLLLALPATAQNDPENIEQVGDPETVGTVPVNDSEPPPEEELSTTYSSIGIQKISADFDNVEDTINLDATLIGLRIPTVPWFGVELNLGFTMIPGQVTPGQAQAGCGGVLEPPCPGTTTASNDFGATTAGVYGVFRSPGKFFAMGKYGYRYINTSLPELQDDRTGYGWGLGVGYRWNTKGSYAELGYLKLSEDITSLGFSISYTYERR